jgi:hypothetical protein
MTMKNKIIKIYISVFLLALSACQNKNANQTMDLQGKKAPVVANPAIELNLPTAAAATGTTSEPGPAFNAQNSNRYTYQILSDDKKLPDTSQLTATVSELTKSRLSLKTSEGKLIQMDYTLPENQALRLSVNESVSLVKKEAIQGSSLNRFLLMTANRGVVISSTTQISNKPIQVELGKGLGIRQGNYDPQKIVSDTKYDTQYNAPVTLLLNGKPTSLDPANPTSFSFNGAHYKLSLYQSRYIQPKKEFVGVSEGQGYLLNYLLLLTQ